MNSFVAMARNQSAESCETIEELEKFDRDTGNRGEGDEEFSLRNVSRRLNKLDSQGSKKSNTRSLFLFGEDNVIRRYAQMIIEWGYPLNLFIVIYLMNIQFNMDIIRIFIIVYLMDIQSNMDPILIYN